MLFEGINSLQKAYEDIQKDKIADGGLKTYNNSKRFASDSPRDIVFDYNIVDSYCSEIRDYIDSNDFGAVRTDGLSSYYLEKKVEQCDGYEGSFDVEGSFMYGFGAALCKAVEMESRGTVGNPDIEQMIAEMLEEEDELYYLKKETMIMKKGAYDWMTHLEKVQNYR